MVVLLIFLKGNGEFWGAIPIGRIPGQPCMSTAPVTSSKLNKECHVEHHMEG